MTNAEKQYITTHSKNKGLGFVLALLLGPLGLFYSNWIPALILCAIAFASAASIIGPFICWILAIIISIPAINNHNQKVKAAAALGVRG